MITFPSFQRNLFLKMEATNPCETPDVPQCCDEGDLKCN
jgi:hypothetical protein